MPTSLKAMRSTVLTSRLVVFLPLLAGHYVGWSRVTSSTTVGELEDPNKQDWYRFDDEKVSVVEKSKILTLDGGGSFRFPFPPSDDFLFESACAALPDAHFRSNRRRSYCVHSSLCLEEARLRRAERGDAMIALMLLKITFTENQQRIGNDVIC